MAAHVLLRAIVATVSQNLDGDVKISEAAKRAGVNVQTLPYYEGRGLIPEPRRTSANHRDYGEDTIERVRFIKRAQLLGFDLEKIGELLRLSDAPRAERARVRAVAEGRLNQLEQRLDEITRARDAIHALVVACRGRKRRPGCPILEALDGTEPLIPSG